MSIVIIHSRLSITILLYAIILSFWGFWKYYRKERIDGNFWGALAVVEILILVQGILGGIMYFTGLQPERGGMHILYGVFGALGIPIIYLLTKGNDERKVTLVYTAVLLLNTVIFIRSMATG